MLNPPLSSLPNELLAYIVDHVSDQEKTLRNLSLADRAFTHLCQTYIIRVLRLEDCVGSQHTSKMLGNLSKLLDKKPSLSRRVRVVDLVITSERNAWFFNHGTLLNMIQFLAKSPLPPHELHFGGHIYPHHYCKTIEDPILVVGWLTKSFFSHSLTVLHLTNCKNVPLPVFHVCSRLREVILDNVRATDESYDNYPVEQCSGRDSPSLEHLEYRNSHSVVKQMITPPPSFHTPVVLWSKLRVLTLSPYEKEEMICLQPILNRACNTLEELYLTHLYGNTNSGQLPLTGLVDLSSLSTLRVFALYAVIKCSPSEPAVLRDVSIVLGTISASNNVTNLFFNFNIVGEQPYIGCLEQDWVGLRNEVIRISAGKPLELDFQTFVTGGLDHYNNPGIVELYAKIMDKTTLSDHRNICTHFWDPTCSIFDGNPFPRGHVRSRCRR